MIESDFISPDDETVTQALNVPVFCSLPRGNVEQVLGRCKVRTYDPGEDILTEGFKEEWMYVMLSGKVAVRKQGIPIATFQRFGDVFGELGIMENVPSGATVRAVKKTICLAVDISVVDLMSPDEQLVFQAVFHRVLAEKLADRTRELDRDLARKTDLLARYAAKFGALD